MLISAAASNIHINGLPVVAGVELGGTKCIATLARGPGFVIEQRSVVTTTPDETLGQLRAIVDDWYDEYRFPAIGVASFGPVDLDQSSPCYGAIRTTTKRGWVGTPVVDVLTGDLPVAVAFDTDVNGAAMAEMCWGSGQGLSDFAYVTVGTGVGVGIIVNGQPTRGFGHSEMGHMRVPQLHADHGPSGCSFHADCVEGLASGTGIRAALGDRSMSDVGPDDPVWDRVVGALVHLAHNLVCSTAPLKIAMGGGVLERQPHLLPRIEPALIASLNGYIDLPQDGPYIVAPSLNAQAGALGPIALAQKMLGMSADHKAANPAS